MRYIMEYYNGQRTNPYPWKRLKLGDIVMIHGYIDRLNMQQSASTFAKRHGWKITTEYMDPNHPTNPTPTESGQPEMRCQRIK